MSTEGARGPSIETLAYTCAFDVLGETPAATALARDLLRAVHRSGLKSPYAEALLRRLALAEWTKRDRPRPARLESKDAKEGASLLFFLSSWGATYEDIATALAVTEEKARQLAHRARLEQVATFAHIPFAASECRTPREQLSDLHEGRLSPSAAEDVTRHLRSCRECRVLDAHLVTVLQAPLRAPLEPPPGALAGGASPSAAWLKFDPASQTQRKVGAVLLGVGLLFGTVQLHPGLNAWATASADRASASFARFRGRTERWMEDLRVLRALAAGSVEGRTEELSQALDEYVNSDSASPAPSPSPLRSPANKPQSAPVQPTRDPAPGVLHP